jgi:hypothetical protein
MTMPRNNTSLLVGDDEDDDYDDDGEELWVEGKKTNIGGEKMGYIACPHTWDEGCLTWQQLPASGYGCGLWSQDGRGVLGS